MFALVALGVLSVEIIECFHKALDGVRVRSVESGETFRRIGGRTR